MKSFVSFLVALLIALAPATSFAAAGYCANGSTCDTSTSSCTDGSTCYAVNVGGGSGSGLNTSLLVTYAQQIVWFINFILVPLLTAVAFIVFLWGVYKYFIQGAASDDSRKEGKGFVMYGIIGFVIIFSIWGLVNIGVSILNVPTGGRPSSLPYPAL